MAYGRPSLSANELRRLLDSLGPDEQIPTNELAQIYQPQQGGFVRNEDSGQTLFLNGRQGGIDDSPVSWVDNGRGGVEPSNFRAPPMDEPQQMQQPQTQRIKVAGIDPNYGWSDLGGRDAPPPQMDYSRPGIEIAGRGKGMYGKDGKVYLKDGQGGLTQVLMGYDRDASWQAARHDFERRKGEQDILASQANVEHTQEQTDASRQARNTKEGLPGFGVPQSVLDKQFGKAPDGQRWTQQGVLEDVPGSNGGKLNEAQGKAAGMATRAEAAHNILLEMEGKGVTTPSIIKQGLEAVPIVGGILGTSANALNIPSNDQRKVEQAQRDFVNAVLRPESGASISASEFDNARKQYFPQVGDDAATILQKQQARERELAALGVMSGPSGVAATKKAGAAKGGFDSRPNPADYRGQIMRDSKTGVRYRSNGSQWETL